MNPIKTAWVESDSGKVYQDTTNAELESKIVDNGKKVIGRPKNAWNPSRLRKVIRLYAMTTLTMDEIRDVIRTKNFMPCKRDIQKQLHALFQIRPSKIRSRGNNTKLLQSFRECRPVDTCNSLQPDCNIDDHESLDLEDMMWDEKSPLPEHNNDWLDLFDNITEVEVSGKRDSSVRRSRRRLSKLNISGQKSKIKPPKRLENTITTTITAGDLSCPLMRNMSHEDAMEVRRFTTFTIESCSVSVVSIDSLRGRLAHKTESCVEDVISVLQNFTISGSTIASRKFDAGKPWECSSKTSYYNQETEHQVSESASSLPTGPWISQQPVLLDHDLALPGQFASSVPLTLSGPVQILTSLWRHAKGQALFSHSGLADWSSVLNEMDDTDGTRLRQVDSLGHSILHIAAATGAKVKLLLDMIDLGADIHARNSGGETFLHLVRNVSSLDRMQLRLLLPRLQKEGFNFSRRDDHGQTPLHLLCRQWVDLPALEAILESLLSCGIEIPFSRDNLGRTVLGQITDTELNVPAIERLQEVVMAYNVAKSHDIHDTEEEQYVAAQSHEPQKHCQPNYGPRTCIETMKDLQLYEFHADLLRTIRRAISSPRYEDDLGRNGLHCLAEVSLSLPIPNHLPPNKANNLTQREAYLSDLIEAKVDPDDCDKAGVTPLMAFIIHTRDDEDDETTIRILTRLHSAGANLNRRDRNGQTPLHLSVSLGKTAITKFLIGNGANIHARDSKGKSIIVTGKAHSDKASSDVKLYAQIMICIACVVDGGGVCAPTHSQEWAQ